MGFWLGNYWLMNSLLWDLKSCIKHIRVSEAKLNLALAKDRKSVAAYIFLSIRHI
jgi:hypothetical protein